MKPWTGLARLHCDHRGAIAPVMILAFIFFGFMAVMILNTGQAIGDKVRVQNGADAAAMTQGDWSARHLNTMSMNNVALTQSAVAMVVSFTTTYVVADYARRAIGTRNAIMEHAYTYCPWLGWPPAIAECIEDYEMYTWPADAAFATAVGYLARYNLPMGVWTAAATVETLNGMNDYLVESLPARVGRVTQEMIKHNDIESVFFYPPCDASIPSCSANQTIQGSSLPVTYGGIARAAAFHELCDAASTGSDGSHRLNFDKLGYPRGKGPYTGGGSSSYPHVRDYISHETILGDMLVVFKAVYPSGPPFLRWLLGLENAPVYEDSQSLSENEFTRKMDSFWDAFCNGGTLASFADGLLGININLPLPRPYSLKGSISSVLPGFSGAQGQVSTLCLQDDFHFLAYATRRTRYRISAGIYSSALERDYAYGQSCVFNDKSFDLYTQYWQAKMMAAKYMDTPDQVRDQLDRRAPSAFRELVEVLQRAGSLDAFKAVNVH